MQKHHLTIIAISFAVLSCSLFSNIEKTESYSVSADRVYINDNDLSFKLPPNWDSKPSHQQSPGSLKLISFTRSEPILIVENQALYPTITILTEKLSQTTNPQSYDEYVRTVVEDAGMTIESQESLTPGGDILPQINGVGWKVFVHTQQGDIMGYMIHIVNQQTGIRFLLESSPENFEDIDPEFIEIIKSIRLEE